MDAQIREHGERAQDKQHVFHGRSPPLPGGFGFVLAIAFGFRARLLARAQTQQAPGRCDLRLAIKTRDLICGFPEMNDQSSGLADVVSAPKKTSEHEESAALGTRVPKYRGESEDEL